MFRAKSACLVSLRFYSTAGNTKPSIKLVAKLRRRTGASITKACEALITSNNDIDSALEWLQQNLIISGTKQAAKVAGRDASEGLITTSVLARGCGDKYWGVRAAMVELNCETDFVARNELFGKLAADIAHTAAFVSEESTNSTLSPCPLEILNSAPLIAANPSATASHTVADSIRELIAKVGEKVFLRRATVIAQGNSSPNLRTQAYRVASYVHGTSTSQGRIGTLAVLGLRSTRLPHLLQHAAFIQNLERLERSLGRQIVGFGPETVRPLPGSSNETSLYGMPFTMLDGSENSVDSCLHDWSSQNGMIGDELDGDENSLGSGVHVLEFAKWTVGEHLLQ